MKHLFLTLFFTFVTCLVYSQIFEWAKGVGGSSAEAGNAIATDAGGNVYITGYFQGTVDFDPSTSIFNLTSKGGDDIFISKLDSAGNLVWAKSMGGLGDDWGNSLALDAYGNVYITGSFSATADFDPSPNTINLTSAGAYDIFITKLDGGGNILWAKRFGGNAVDKGNSLALDPYGNVYTMGNFSTTADFDPSGNTFNLTSAGAYDIFITKLDASGNFLWAKGFGGTGYEEGYSLAVDAQGNVYATGYFSSFLVDFDPNAGVYNLTPSSLAAIFITKLNSAGNHIWTKKIGGGANDYANAYAIVLDIQGNIYTTGSFRGTTDFNPGTGIYNIYNVTSAGLSDIFVSKLDSFGNFVWAKTMGGTDDDIGTSIALDAQGHVFTTGYFQNSADFNPDSGTYNIVSMGMGDIFISKLDILGNFVSAKTMGGIGQDEGNALATGTQSSLFTTGLFENTVDFDPGNGISNLSSAGDKDIFAHKMDYCTNYDTFIITACDFYTANGQTYIIGGTYTQILTNTLGCDSILTLNLTINHSTDSMINQVACDTFAFNGQSYTATGNYTHYFTNSSGCDSTVYLNLMISNMGTDTLIETACQYYTLNGQTYTSSGIYSQAIPGCDSAITLMLTLNNPTTITTTLTACNPLTINGQTYTTSGTYTQTLTNVGGCDSLLTLNLTINHSTDTLITQIACDSFTLNGQTYNTTGTYTQLLTNMLGCDSLLTLNLILGLASYNTLIQTSCNTTTINGQIYTTSGTYTQILTNAVGCDSVLTINLTLFSNDSSSFSDYGCDDYSWGNQNYTTSGIYTQTFTNTTGCDSIVTLNLNLGHTQYLYNTLDVCNSYVCHGITHYTDGNCDSTYTDSLGCVTHNITSYYISGPYEIDDFITSCGPYYDSNTGQQYNTSSYYDWFEPTGGGIPPCGVIHHVDLSVVYIDTSITRNGNTLISNQSWANYWWIDCNAWTIPGATNQSFTPSQNGSYAVEIHVGECYDWSNCYTILNVGVEDNLFSQQLQAYPNPTTGDLTIDLGAEYELTEVKISSVIGQELSTQKYTNFQLLTVEMPELTGVYFVTIVLKNGEQTTIKVIKE